MCAFIFLNCLISFEEAGSGAWGFRREAVTNLGQAPTHHRPNTLTVASYRANSESSITLYELPRRKPIPTTGRAHRFNQSGANKTNDSKTNTDLIEEI